MSKPSDPRPPGDTARSDAGLARRITLYELKRGEPAASDRNGESVHTEFARLPHQTESPMLRLARAAAFHFTLNQHRVRSLTAASIKAPNPGVRGRQIF